MGVDSVGGSSSNRGSSGTSSTSNAPAPAANNSGTNSIPVESKPASPARVNFDESRFSPNPPRSSVRPELDPKPLEQQAVLTAPSFGPGALQATAMGPPTSFKARELDSTGHLKSMGLPTTSFQRQNQSVPLPQPRPAHLDQPAPQAPIPQTRPANLAPRTATAPGIQLGADVVPSAFSAHSTRVVQDIMAAAGVTNLRISSTARTPEAQARAMYDNIQNKGVRSQLALYGAPGDAVVETYVAAQNAGLSREETLRAMTDKINELGPSTVSRHAASPEQIARLNIIDISPRSIPASQHEAFIAAIRANPEVSRFLGPADGDPAFHLEIPQPQ
ncbi:hypothetical protein F0U62_05670 [Cystobacter fuscus]|uniref:hypothetical protein n=1 Tax=Cystobacter fuscus TaxID=43 RepID=UPI002B31416A|nr:hypothetical protein F0U62_05670 [Cystobacter fuscus]